MKELTISDLFDIFIDNVVIIILTTILFGILSVGYTNLVITPMYEASTKIILVKADQTETTTGLTSNDITLNQKLVSTYSEIIKSRKVIDTVITNLALEMGYNDIVNNITVSPVKDSEVINITVETINPEMSAAFANELVNVFSSEITNIYKMDNVTQVDTAIPVAEPVNVSLATNLILFSAAGFILTYGIFFIKEFFKTTMSSADELEQVLEIGVLGIIPDLVEVE